jgi:polyisoprenoid-binding protein YceI
VSKLLFTTAVAAIGLALAQPALAQSVTADPAAVKSGAFKVETFHTQVGFSVSHLGITPFTGVFHDAAGTLTLNAADPAASKVRITVPVASVLTTVPVLDGMLKGKDWFDAATFPTATFTSTEVRRTGPNTAAIQGDLTLHGVTKPIQLEAKLVGSGVNMLDKAYSVGFTAKGVFKRSDFGIKTYLPAVGDDVELTIQAAFEAQP